ncbi:MAG: US12 family protein [bacterium]|nr:US12 family protein [Candidatus Minthenecus merdequi]
MGLFGTKTAEDGHELSTREERILERGVAAEGENIISDSLYNVVLGGTVAYGLLLNAVMVWFFGHDLTVFINHNPGMYYVILIGYIVFGITGIVMAYKSKSARISFIGYNLLVVPMGAILAIYVPMFSPMIVAKATFLTGFITLLMMGFGAAFPKVFARMGATLGITLLITLIVEIISILVFGYQGILFDLIFVVLFSFYIGYDFSRSQAYAKTFDNAVDSAVDIYLDIINLFIRILSILGKRN